MKLPAYINGRLDDYGLTLIQFRIYCHIARRGECFENADTMAELCRVNRCSIWPALQFLTERNLIKRESRPGRTTILRVTPISSWLPNPGGNNTRVVRRAGRPRSLTRAEIIPDTRAERNTDRSGGNNTHKVDPIEVDPIKGTETGSINPIYSSQRNSKNRKPVSVEEVVVFALCYFKVPSATIDNWLIAGARKDLRSGKITAQKIMEKAGEHGAYYLQKAFRFIYYNNRAGWNLAHSWKSACSGFLEKCDYGAGSADPPKAWIPHISDSEAIEVAA